MLLQENGACERKTIMFFFCFCWYNFLCFPVRSFFRLFFFVFLFNLLLSFFHFEDLEIPQQKEKTIVTISFPRAINNMQISRRKVTPKAIKVLYC